MSGFLSFLFVLFFTVTLTLAIDRRKERPRLSNVMWVLSGVFAVAASIAGYIHYLSPAPSTVIQNIAPPEKPYIYIKDSKIEDVASGKSPFIMLVIKNGPTESTGRFSNITFKLTRFVPETYLRYSARPAEQVLTFAPNQEITGRWIDPDLVLTQDDIADLNADKPLAELYIFGRGEFTDEKGKHPLNPCWRYDKTFPGNLVYCGADIKID